MKYLLGIITFVSFIVLHQNDVKIAKTTIVTNGFTTSGYKDGLILSLKGSKEKFYSLYYSRIDKEEHLETPIRLKFKNRNSYTNVSHGTFVPVFDEFYFTANNKTGKLVLYRCKIKDLELIKPKQVHLAEIDNFGQTTFSENGLRMIVSSENNQAVNLKLYTRVNQFSTWQFKRDLSELNSEGMELHQHLASDTLIYFSRRDLQTKTMNLYVSTLSVHNIWSEPELCKSLNSKYDDFGLVFTNENSGYFTSNREGTDKIYYFENLN